MGTDHVEAAITEQRIEVLEPPSADVNVNGGGKRVRRKPLEQLLRGSTPTTVQPRRARRIACVPCPQPTSNTFTPSRT